ncbi:MAG: hypothetical protein K0R38_1304 [Polyangiaceae bacterium]|jgi:hypothetical protein|nr:hypothetical protein [Polyangiaceae bacterium]
MSIDGIGKRGGVTPGAPLPGVTPAQGDFQVGLSSAPAADPSAAVAGSDAFQALERGEINVAQYLDARVEGAVAPLLSKLSPEQLEFVRAELRAALETDPVLVELVRKTTAGAVSSG